MKRLFQSALLLLSVVFYFSSDVFAAHPLITDDTGTQGKGKFQLELNGQYGHDSEDGTTQNSTQVSTALTYGLIDNLDMAVGIPYQFTRTKTTTANEDGSTSATAVGEDGVSDISIALKWRFLEKDKLSFALKPGITLPTGSKRRGLGTGEATYSLFLITTQEIDPVAFHLNLGYIRNENKTEQKEDLWHASLASEIKAIEDLKFVLNIGIQSNTVKTSHVHPIFLLGGIIYSISKSLDIDVGYKHGLNKHEIDHTALAGLTFKF